jgi:hypothetical protein
MNVTRNTTTRLIASLGVAAAGAITPALLFLSAGTAHADDPCYGDLAYSYYCSPASSAIDPQPVAPAYTPPSPNLWAALPQCSGGVLAALGGDCS